jgi:hypothetical protein
MTLGIESRDSERLREARLEDIVGGAGWKKEIGHDDPRSDPPSIQKTSNSPKQSTSSF